MFRFKAVPPLWTTPEHNRSSSPPGSAASGEASHHGLGAISEQHLVQFVRQAGSLTLQYFRKNLRQIEKPGHQGIVTEADLAAESLLKSMILEAYPDSAFIAEESMATGAWGPDGLSAEARATLGNRLVWVIDPIDGTTNFAKGNPYYCLSMAVGRCSPEGSFVTEWGVVHQPTTGDLYIARRGCGAKLNDEPLVLHAPATMRSACFCTGFGYQTGDMLERILRASAAIKDVSLGLRINGAAALDIALTAAHRFDGFFEVRLMPWDMAAGALIAQEAGLLVSTIRGEPYSVLDHSSIVVCHPDLNSSLLEILRKHLT